MILVNFLGGPGTGKSTTAAYVFAKLKLNGVKAELVGEEAKDIVFNKAEAMLDNQILLLGHQYQRTKRLEEAGAEVAICDSPFVLSAWYGQNLPYASELTSLVRRLESLYPNTVNFYVRRIKPYVKFGRCQDAEEAAAIDGQVLKLVSDVVWVDGSEEGANTAFKLIMKFF